MSKNSVRPSLAWVYARPWRFIAFCMGSGVIHPGPGTWGTVWAWGIWLVALQFLPFGLMGALLAIGFGVGIWVCQRTGEDLEVEDHSGMNWDEAIAFWLVLWLIPSSSWWMQLCAFILFRIFDIAKPAPIRYVDQRVSGGFGVMIDDIVAALYTLIVLFGIYSFV